MNKNIAMLLVAVVFAGSGFYAGIKYQTSKAPVRGAGFTAFTGGNAGIGRGRGGAGLNGTFGQVISKTDASITVQLMDGSSKIVFVSGTTPVAKQAAGTLTDVSVGSNIAVTGTANSDGSITASQIQLRPTGSPRPSPTPTQ